MRYSECNFAFEKRKYCNRFCYNTNPDVIKDRQKATQGKHWKLSEITKKKMALSKMCEKNPQWMGDNYTSLPTVHVWIRRRKPKPEFCECCKVKRPYDLANIRGTYKRDINDYEWLCRKCHMVKDGRIHNLKKGKNINIGYNV